MTDYTPRTIDVRGGYAASRLASNNIGWFYGFREFDRWLAAHDQGVRDAMTAREHLEAAWDAAFPVPEGRVIPPDTGFIARNSRDGEIVVYSRGCGYELMSTGEIERRTLDPLPPLIPDDCNLVWAGNPDRRVVWHRDPSNPDRWNGYDVAGHAANLYRDNLIDPKPVPEEER